MSKHNGALPLYELTSATQGNPQHSVWLPKLSFAGSLQSIILEIVVDLLLSQSIFQEHCLVLLDMHIPNGIVYVPSG